MRSGLNVLSGHQLQFYVYSTLMTSDPETVKAQFKELKRGPLQAFPARRQKLDASNRQGVYLIYSPDGAVLHVGRTYRGKNGLAQRLRDHMAGASSFTSQHLNGHGSMLRDGYKYRCLVVENPRLRALLEAYATGCLCPVHIGTGQHASKKSA